MKVYFYIFAALMSFTQVAVACPLCHTGTGEQVRRGILDQNFLFNLTAAFTPFVIIAVIISMILYEKNHQGVRMIQKLNFKPLVAAGTLIGVGMGGFADGILLHQILQVHNMLSNQLFPDTLVNAEINMFWDGLFHAFTWVTTLIGIGYLWKITSRDDVPRSTATLLGSTLFGWGVFNLVEGIIDHQILQVHHVIQRAPEPQRFYYDMAFLAFAVVQIVVGLYVNSRAKKKIMGTDREDTYSRTHQWKLVRH